MNDPFHDRELSWLSFNARVLQEAADPSVPLFERLGFLAIFSSNLDEFFRVRVASLRSLLRLKKKRIRRLRISPARLLREIHGVVSAQQERFGEIFRAQLLPALKAEGIVLVHDRAVSSPGRTLALQHFTSEVRPLLEPRVLDREEDPPFLRNRGIYLVVELWPDARVERPDFALVEIPSPPLPRFVPLGERDGTTEIMFLDDVVRLGLPDLFPGMEVGRAFSVKLTRDAELYVDDEFDGDLVEAIRKSLSRRETGVPSRFLYDMEASYSLVSYLKDCLGLAEEDLVVGGRYHNLHDLGDFPRLGRDDLCNPPRPPFPHSELAERDGILDAVSRKDRLLHFPYQSYGTLVRFLEEAAADPDVEEIYLSIYRVAPDSAVLGALVKAAHRGVAVHVFVEVQARFDEASNLEWAERLEDAGVRTYYSIPGLKVHAKLALVVRREAGERRLYACVATGNFNEKTARLYTDVALLTADPVIGRDVESVFAFLTDRVTEPRFARVIVAPFCMREEIYALFDGQIARARRDGSGLIVAKMNALEDEETIGRLYDASRAGVEIRLLIRGICCLVAGVEAQSETIEVRSIVDRYLEHSRVWAFGPGGEDGVFIASADWMHRNLSRRVEVAVPIADPGIRAELIETLDVLWSDDTKARIVDRRLRNAYVPRGDAAPVRGQEVLRKLLAARTEASPSTDADGTGIRP